MKKLKKSLFTIPTILAAGAISADNSNDEIIKAEAESQEGFFSKVKEYIVNIKDNQSYTLAQHSSHASHGSHG